MMQNGFVTGVLFLFLSGGCLGDPQQPYDAFGVSDLVTFRLFTRQDEYNGMVLRPGDKHQLLTSGFNASLTTIICTHGFMDSANSSWITKLKRNILRREEVNFISVDYSLPAKNLLYDEVVMFARKVGMFVGGFLKFLQEEGNSPPERAHLIGHSIGAQVLGHAARAFPAKTIGRLTGLDPAAPLYENNPETERINPKLAKVVDAIHTCVFFVGMKKPAGIIDFYPNGGFNQPGCEKSDLACHHGRSRDYFSDSIRPGNLNKYVASKCKTLEDALKGTCNGQYARMGYYLQYNSPGIYYIEIN